MRAKQFFKKLKESVGDGDVANAVVAEVIKLIGEGHTEVSPDVITTKVSAVLGRPFMLKDLVAANNSSPELQHYIDTINPSKIKFSTDILTVKNEDPMKEKAKAQSGVANMAARAAGRDRSLAEHADDPKLEKRLSKTVPGYNKSMDRAQRYAKEAHKAQAKSKSVKEGIDDAAQDADYNTGHKKGLRDAKAGKPNNAKECISAHEKKGYNAGYKSLKEGWFSRSTMSTPLSIPSYAKVGDLITITKTHPQLDIIPGDQYRVTSSDNEGVTVDHNLGTKFKNTKIPHSSYKSLKESDQGISKSAETKFHKKLDTLVHDTFGKRKEEMKEGVTSPAIQQAYKDIFKTEPHTPERERAVEHYQSLRRQEMKAKKSVKEAKGRPTTMQNDFYVYDETTKKIKKPFRTHKGASAYAEKNGGKVCSSEYYADKIAKKSTNENRLSEAPMKAARSTIPYERWAEMSPQEQERIKSYTPGLKVIGEPKPKKPRAASAPRTPKEQPNYGRIMMDIDAAIGDSFPDGDPIDRLQKYMGDFGSTALLDKAVRKHTKFKSYGDYVAGIWQQHIDDNPEFDQQNPWTESINENAEELNIGDDVIITGPVEFQGKTGVIDSFGRDKRFVVVNLYNYGRHSFHSSDVEYNDYADQDDEEFDPSNPTHFDHDDDELQESIPYDGQHRIRSAKRFIRAAQVIGATVQEEEDGDLLAVSGTTVVGAFSRDENIGWLYAPSTDSADLKEDEYEDDYKDEEDEVDEDQGFFVFIGDEYENGGFIGMVVKDGGKWRERAYKGTPPNNWGGTYMGYLTPQDVMTWINKDYGRNYQVEGPMSEDEANEYLDYMSEGASYDPTKGYAGKKWSDIPSKLERQQQKRVPLRTFQELCDMIGINRYQLANIAKKVSDFPKPVAGIGGKKTYYDPQKFMQWFKQNDIKKYLTPTTTVDEDEQLNELNTHYDQVKHKGQLLVLDRWPDGHLTISVGTRVLKSGPFNQIKPLWDKLKGEKVAEGWESGPEERALRERDPDADYDARRQAKADRAEEEKPKKVTYKLNGRGPNMEPNYDFGLDEFDSQEEAVAARDRLMADPSTPNPRMIGIQMIRRSIPGA